MARPGLDKNVKFRTLCRLLKEPRPHVRGYLELLWEVAYENGEPVIGDPEAVESAAEYPGEPGTLFKALLACGGAGKSGFIEPAKVDGLYQVHDLLDNAPEYVTNRAMRECERRKEKECEQCGSHFHSTETHTRFCCDSCRKAKWRETGAGRTRDGRGTHRTERDEPETDEGRTGRSGTGRDEPPAPAPAPAPLIDCKEEEVTVGPDGPPTPKRGSKRFLPPTVGEVTAYCRERGNGIDALRFCDFYESKGWMVGKTPMRDWKAAVRTWERNTRDGNGERSRDGSGTQSHNTAARFNGQVTPCKPRIVEL